ncbi:hypothetical protein CRENBAI_011737, partial [Crenichthys baileyi]
FEQQGGSRTVGVGGRRAFQLHKLEKDTSLLQNEGKQDVCAGMEKSQVANQRLQE